MSDSSSYSNMSDLDDIEDIDLVMQLINEDKQVQGESSHRSRKAINRERDVAEARLMADYFAFVKSFMVAQDERNAVFKRRQESARKDVERAFGVLQGRWHIIAQPTRSWTVNMLTKNHVQRASYCKHDFKKTEDLAPIRRCDT
ncbi:ALP1-like protein isoform X1 [Tanacetum coccineum]